MTAPFTAAPAVPVKRRLISLLAALDYGLYPADGSTDEQCGQAVADMTAVAEAVAAVQSADGDFEARREFLGGMAGLAGLTRYGIAGGTVTAGGGR